ncbi:hypothetical protein C8F01DRAFT_1179470 [Mycena amicta]|nr:hypothetical protein C8F01DRAFT_1179470 [Mycena amicta]
MSSIHPLPSDAPRARGIAGGLGRRPFRGSGDRGRRGRGFRGGPPQQPGVEIPADRSILEGLLPIPLETIAIPSLAAHSSEVVIRNMKLLGSYNWGKATAPTIIVPGSPPEWKNRTLPYQVEPDTGIVFVDENAFRAPNGYALLPLIAAVDKTHERAALESHHGSVATELFDWAGEKVDFITTRNALRRLLRWIDSEGDTASRSPFERPRDFRIDTQLAGRTVFLNRWEKRDRAQMDGYTYGLNFEKASTIPASEITENTGHQRIVCYDLNGLKMVVRFEVDAYLPEIFHPKRKFDSAPTLEGLAARLANIDFNPKVNRNSPPSSRASASPEPYTTYHGLMVIESGTPVDQASLVDLSTRSTRRMLDLNWGDFYAQHFLSQTNMHFIGVHEYGRFIRVVKREALGSRVEDDAAQPSLKRLRRLLQVIRDVVVRHGQRGRLTLVCQNGELTVYERDGMENCLPEEVLERFME